MVQEIEMTVDEQMTMYMKCSKKELCKMLIEANKHLKNLPIHVVSKSVTCEACDGYGYTVDVYGRRDKHCTNCE